MVTISFRIVLTHIRTRVYKDFTLKSQPYITIYLVVQFDYPQLRSLISLLMLIIDIMHSLEYQSNIGGDHHDMYDMRSMVMDKQGEMVFTSMAIHAYGKFA